MRKNLKKRMVSVMVCSMLLTSAVPAGATMNPSEITITKETVNPYIVYF
ncbi:MAG: hypothetical protein ACI4CT_00650 [Lachnospiraceae bacterium]